MRSLISAAVLASVFGPLATTAFAADLDHGAPPPPFYDRGYERGPVPPAFVPNGPVVYRAPLVYPRIVRPYLRPYPYGPRPVVRVYGAPRVYGEGYGRPRGPSFYGEPGRHGYERDREARRDQEYGRDGYHDGDRREGYGHEGYGHHGDELSRRNREGGYGHYLSRDELERRAAREHGGYGRDERYADRGGPGRDFDR